MRKVLGLSMLAIYVSLSTTIVLAETKTVTGTEQNAWLRRLLPLPHEISIERKVTLDPSDIAIITGKDAGPAVLKAAESLKNLLAAKTGKTPSGKRFEILLGMLDSRGTVDGVSVQNADRLRELPNSDQAYTIRAVGDSKLVLAALDEKGVYYAASTLCQLIEPFLTPERAVFPLADVVDWPDMEERGLWNFPDPDEWIPWMSSMKLNYGKMVKTQLQTIERGKPNRAAIDKELMLDARSMGFNYLPFILHLNFLHAHGMFRAYPELAGVGDSALAGRYFAHKIGNQHRAPCAANPVLSKILAEWMLDIASQGADEVSCWLSERPAQCGHKECREIGQFVLEARAFVNAWRETRKKYPDFIIRLFISTTTNERYYKILAETPPEVRLERCCSTELERVRHEPRDLFVNPLFDSYAAKGRWVAHYDVPIGAFGRVETPEFKVPCSSVHRIRDYVRQLAERSYRGAYGMMGWGTQGIETCGFNISALAEWSWNLNGRTEKEFAAAWATRQGFDNPEAVAEWSEIMGPIEFDVYESDFPTCYSWGKFFSMVDERRLPLLGEDVFRYYRTIGDFQKKIAACGRALEISRSFDTPHLANETEVVLSYVRLAYAIYTVAEQVASGDVSSPENQKRLGVNLASLESTGKENVAAIRKWRSALGPEPWHYRVHDAIKGTEITAGDIVRLVRGKYMY